MNLCIEDCILQAKMSYEYPWSFVWLLSREISCFLMNMFPSLFIVHLLACSLSESLKTRRGAPLQASGFEDRYVFFEFWLIIKV